MSKNSERGYCSSCFQYTKHKFIEQSYLRRNVYECTNCKSKTLQCRACNNFTRSGEKWDDEFCAEHNGFIANFKKLDKKLDNLDDYEEIFERKSINFKRVGTIVAATVSSVAMITPLAIAAAPAIGGAIGTTVFGLSGAAASSAGLASIGGGALAAGGLGMAGGVAVVGTAGAALGGILGGVVSNSYISDIDDFEIKKIKDGKGPAILFINGFLTQKDNDTKDWEEQLKKLYPNNPWYYVSWESKRLRDLGKSILGGSGKEAIRQGVMQLAKKATSEGAKKLGPLAPILAAFGIANNPWSVALVKAEQTGVLLADILARTNDKYILCGHSLGARVIYRTLDSLSTKKSQWITDTHLLGGAVGSDKKSWEKAKKAVSGNIINYRSDNDYVLATMYKLGTLFQSDPIGRHCIDVNGIMDVDVSDVVNGHTEYKKNFASISKLNKKHDKIVLNLNREDDIMSIKDEAEILRKKLEEEKKNPIKIALFGQPGAGKSSIINKLVGADVAAVGARTDVTIDAQIIEWNDLILVDLPGYGTSKFPKNGYFDKFDLNDYDLFLCIFSGKFHEADTEFFKEIRDGSKTALLVRNQCDMLWEEGKTFEDLVQDITADAQKHVQSSEEVYFTSCRDNDGFDELQTAIYNNIDASKKERWTRGAKAYSIEALEAKREACQTEIYTYAGLSAANALNPIPGADVAVDVGILLRLFKDIKDNYGLTDEKLQNGHIVEKFGPVINQMMQYGTKEGILILLKQFAGRETIKTVAKYIPGVGTVIAASLGFGIIMYAGKQYLEDCHKVAKGILEEELKA